jgi:hypothetical protein
MNILGSKWFTVVAIVVAVFAILAVIKDVL